MNEAFTQSDAPHFEQKLRRRREQLREEIADARTRRESERFTQMAGEAYDSGDSSVASLTMDTTNADIRRDDRELDDLEKALARVESGGYGMCLRCGQPIERARLEAYPAAKRHVRCQEAHDREHGVTTPTPSL